MIPQNVKAASNSILIVIATNNFQFNIWKTEESHRQRHRESLVIFITVFDRLYVSGNNTEVTCYYSATRSQLSWFLIQFMICWEFQCFHSDVTLHSDICGWKWRNINFRAFVITNSTSYQKQFVLRVWGQAKIYV